MNNNHPDNLSDELVSAYLDGELSGDDQARVEHLIASSEEHRQMLDEFRALRDSLQSMPKFQLDDDFGKRVMRRVDEAMASGGEAVTPRPISTERRKWLPMAVVAGALAATLLAALMIPQVYDETPIASVPARNLEESKDVALGGFEETSDTIPEAEFADDLAETSLDEIANAPEPVLAAEEAADAPASLAYRSVSETPSANEDPVHDAKIVAKAAEANKNLAQPSVRGGAGGDLESALTSSAGQHAAPVEQPVLAGKRMTRDPQWLVAVTFRGGVSRDGVFSTTLRDHRINSNSLKKQTDAYAIPGLKRDVDRLAEGKELAGTAAEGFELVYVEASRKQIDAMLADLNSRSDVQLAMGAYAKGGRQLSLGGADGQTALRAKGTVNPTNGQRRRVGQNQRLGAGDVAEPFGADALGDAAPSAQLAAGPRPALAPPVDERQDEGSSFGPSDVVSQAKPNAIAPSAPQEATAGITDRSVIIRRQDPTEVELEEVLSRLARIESRSAGRANEKAKRGALVPGKQSVPARAANRKYEATEADKLKDDDRDEEVVRVLFVLRTAPLGLHVPSTATALEADADEVDAAAAETLQDE